MLAVAAVFTLASRPAGAAPQLGLSPATGPPGTDFTVSGTGFAASDIEIRWGGQNGPILATATGPEFSVSARVPEAPPNSHQVLAVARNGNAVSTSSAPFQVTAAPVETTTTAVPEPATTTTAAPARGSAAASRQTSGVGGGAEDAPDPVAGTSGAQPSTGVPAGSSSGRTTTSTAVVPATTAGAPEPVLDTVPGAAGLPSPAGTPVDAHASASGDRAADAALGERPTSQSSGAVSNPALLIVGLGMIFLGGTFLAVRNRHRPPP